jgi:CubicO group peptidase (beta-lactamase class C family)
MKKLTFLFLVSLLLINCNSKVKNETTSNNPKYPSEIEARIEKVLNNLQVATEVEGNFDSKTLAERMDFYHTPAVSIAVVNNGRIEWARGFGKSDLESNKPTDTETLFQAGSVSKPIFALTVMKLYEENLIDIDRNVNEYLTSWKVPKIENWQPKITLRNLLSHTAGLNVHGFPGYLINDSIPSIPQILNGKSPSNTPAVKVNILPNTNFRYSGGGTIVAQLLMTDVFKKPFPELMDEYLFNPLRLKNSTYNQPLPDNIKDKAATAYPYRNTPVNGRFHIYPEMAAAGLWTTPTELATIMVEIQKGLDGNSSFIKRKTLEEMMERQKMANMIGLGFFQNGKDDSARFYHNGWDEGFIAYFLGYKNTGKGIVIMLNSNEGEGIVEEITNSVSKVYEWADFLPQENKYEVINDSIIEDVGTYGDCKLDLKKGKLFLKYQNQEPLELKKTTDGLYKNKFMNFVIKIKDNQLELTQNGETKTFRKK